MARRPRIGHHRAAMVTKLTLCCLLLVLVPVTAGAQKDSTRVPTALTFEAELSTTPYPAAPGPNVSVHVPAGFDPAAPLHLVIYVHGLRGCLPVLMGRGSSRCDGASAPQAGWDLGAHHDAARTNTLFIVPRLIYGKRGGQPGAFGKDGGFGAFLDELLTGPLSTKLGRPYTRKSITSITLVAHSAGYQTALAILEHGNVEALVRAVVLLDALYDLEDRYARYALAHAHDGFRLVAIHLRGGRPARADAKLQRRLVRELGPEQVVSASGEELRAAISKHPFVFAEGLPGHAEVPRHHMADVLSALGLPAR